MRQKTCSNCGATFSCGAEEGGERCWCAALPHLSLAPVAGSDCFCPQCLTESVLPPGGPAVDQAQDSAGDSAVQPIQAAMRTDLDQQGLLLEGEDYYSEGGLIVFTASYHRRRGYCCESACRHCPFKD